MADSYYEAVVNLYLEVESDLNITLQIE